MTRESISLAKSIDVEGGGDPRLFIERVPFAPPEAKCRPPIRGQHLQPDSLLELEAKIRRRLHSKGVESLVNKWKAARRMAIAKREVTYDQVQDRMDSELEELLHKASSATYKEQDIPACVGLLR
ncbi:hypothetical protein EMCG_02338 [[Emmonsia] crescens]|uniref:Uncharacterized protein n=1 Tax=[Emmonsia] crescens TaxID=73230 RepID=A0A0G2HYE8_9EURO|nr:hypothetical protein EMCG_02338 [Emmonsia crescens UAMH 3008]